MWLLSYKNGKPEEAVFVLGLVSGQSIKVLGSEKNMGCVVIKLFLLPHPEF